MTKEDHNEDQTIAQERPQVYVTRFGRRYVKADELFRSKRGRAMIEKIAEFDFDEKSPARPSPDSQETTVA